MGGRRPYIDKYIDIEALVAPARQMGQQDEMAGRTDRQKLGDSLDQRQDDDVQQRHGANSLRVISSNIDARAEGLYHIAVFGQSKDNLESGGRVRMAGA